jgi:hypothetical protein
VQELLIMQTLTQEPKMIACLEFLKMEQIIRLILALTMQPLMLTQAVLIIQLQEMPIALIQLLVMH